MKIAAWWIPAALPTTRCAILIHGYADAKVGSIAWAPLLHDLGINILAVDLRAHGESDGCYTTAGYWERHDLNYVIDQLRATRPNQTSQLILFGISLGAAVAAAAAARRRDLHAAIFDSPFTDYRQAVAAHLRLLGLPTGWLLELALRLAEFLSKSEFDAVRPIDTIRQMRCPLLIVLGEEDELLEANDRTSLEDSLAAARRAGLSATMAIVPNASHLQAMEADPMAYSQRIRDFLDSIAP